MADLGAVGNAGLMAGGAGPLSHLARAQYRAVVEMRWRMFVNGLRTVRGLFELGATGIAYMVYGVMGLGLGIGLGFGAYSLVSREKWLYLPILFWILFVLWQMIPVALASLQQQLQMNVLLRFPVSFGSFFLLHLVFGLADVSTILGGLCCIGIWVGMSMARPGLFGWTALGLVEFGVFNILMARAILAWIERWLAQRRTREIVSALFLLLLLSLQLLNPALRETRHAAKTGNEALTASQRKTEKELRVWVKTADAAQAWLPPGLAGIALERAAQHQPAAAIGSLGVVGLYALAAGGVLVVRLKAEYRGENLGAAPSRKKAERQESKWLLNGSGPIVAVMEKELHTVLRSTRLLFALAVPVLMVVVIGGLFRSGASEADRPFPLSLALPLCMAYALLGFTQLIYNNLGAEGTGIQLLFLSSTPIRTVMLAKNLFHALLFGLVALLAGVLASMRVGRPDFPVLAATLGWLLFALPANLAAGNAFSLTMPYRVNLGRLMQQPGSQANALFAMLFQTVVLGLGAAVFAICAIFGRPLLAGPIFIIFAGGAVFAWMRVLSKVDAMANQRRDLLIDTLAKTE